jgi:hypothetical protein
MSVSPKLEGLKFGSLLVMKKKRDKIGVVWKCLCVCGMNRDVTTSHLLRGLVKSCGCLNFTWGHGNKKYPPELASFRAKAGNIKAQAKLRGKSFSLAIDETVALIKGNCHYCGCEPDNTYGPEKRRVEIKYNGIDRVDSSKGYVRGNCVSCCRFCNSAKLDKTYQEFMAYLDRLVRHRSGL